jgi:hypothetical protein
VADGFFKSFL